MLLLFLCAGIRGEKVFAAKLKSRTAKLKAISDKNKAKISPTTIISQSAEKYERCKKAKSWFDDIKKND